MRTPSLPELAPHFAEAVHALGLPSHLNDTLDTLYLPVARWVAHAAQARPLPYVLGVNGAQGSGKSTFCHLLATLLRAGFDRSVLVISIDDLYLTRDQRQALADQIHPLCAIRGVPGTHDTTLGTSIFDALDQASETQRTLIPRFDKAQDDRSAQSNWTEWVGRPDIILFEGWCVAAPPLPPWTGPINAREAREDPEGHWITWSIDRHRESYVSLFDRLDGLLMLQVESMDSVRQGRWLQEQALRARFPQGTDTETPPGVMSKAEVMAYVDLFERYTTHMLSILPTQADVLVTRSDDLSYTLVRPETSSSLKEE